MSSTSKADVLRIAREALKGQLSRSGTMIYSSHHTICQGDVYLMGLNPGGDEKGPSLAENLEPSLARESNAYLDEAWGIYGKGEEGNAPLQQRVKWLLEQLGFDVRKVFASNLIFMQSKNERDVTWEDANVCWPVHEALLSIVQPRLILAFGNSSFSPYAYLHWRYGGEQVQVDAGHGNWKLKGFHTCIAGKAVFVVGFPHLSRYCPIGKQGVVDWIRASQ